MRHNNFDIVRLVLAFVVVFVHCYDLSGHQPLLRLIPHLLNAHVAVQGFFAISGFLIFASYERCASLSEYYANRAWRILPGYWMATIFCLGIAFSMGHFHVWKFLLGNLTFANFIQPGIPGVFDSNPGSDAMNGALWTIKIEVMFYIAVPMIVWLCRRMQRDAVLWTLFAASVAFRVIFQDYEKWTVQLPGQLSYFMIGAIIYYHLDFFQKQGKWMMLAAAVCYGLHSYTGWFWPRPAAIAALTLGASLLLPQIKGPTRWGDFSYGTYILHWPIVQITVSFGLFNVHPLGALILTVTIIAIAAVFSWFVVEKPSLAHSKSRKLRQAALDRAPQFA